MVPRKAWFLSVALFLLGPCAHGQQTEPASRAELLLVAHGAPSPSWNRPLVRLAVRVDSVFRTRGSRAFRLVSTAFLEFATPTVAEAVTAAEARGVDSLYVLPIFVAPSGHTIRDLPNVLGLAADPNVRRQLAEEHTPIVHTRLHLILGPTLAWGPFLENALVNQARQLSTSPDSEAVVILAHGDRDFQPIWDRLLKRVGAAICGKIGISWFDAAQIETGQTFAENGLPVIERAARARPRVLVLGLYVNLTPARIAARHQRELEAAEIARTRSVIYSEKALVDDPHLAEWLATLATRIRDTNR